VKTILVLSGFTQRDEIDRYAFQPSRVVNSVADLIDEL
jgi:NagD protein